MLLEILAGGAAGYFVARQVVSGRVSKLETRLRALEQGQGAPAKAAAPAQPAEHSAAVPTNPWSSEPLSQAPEHATPPPVRLPRAVRLPPAAERAPQPPSGAKAAVLSLVQLVMANPFASLGVLLVLVSVGFLFSLLAASSLFPPALRVALVALAGAGGFAIGLRQQAHRPALGLNLQGGALAVQYLCALWAYQGYGLVGSTAAFVWMAGLSTAAMAWSAWQRHGLFAFMGLAGALLTPIAASTGSGEFSGLVLYCAWIAGLGIAVGVYLNMPALASAALAGVSALLGAALGIRTGSTELSLAMLLAMLVAFAATAVHWTREQFVWPQRHVAAVVSVLLGAPLVLTGFMSIKANASDTLAAVVLGACALAYLAWVVRAPQRWKGWLLFIGAGLGVAALAVGFEGASRAVAFSASAMGLVILASSVQRPWAGLAAFIYWGLSVVLGFKPLADGQSMPLVLSGLVALAAGFVSRTSPLGTAYAVLAPLVLWCPVARGQQVLTPHVIGFFVHWALLVCLGTRWLEKRGFAWPALKLSPLWLLPAGLALLLAPERLMLVAGLPVREVVLACWLLLSYQVVEDLLGDTSLSTRLRKAPGDFAALTLLLPAAVAVELLRALPLVGVGTSMAVAVVAVLLAAWANVALSAARLWPGNFQPLVAGAASAALVTYLMTLTRAGTSTAVAAGALVLLWWAALQDPKLAQRKTTRWVYGLGGLTLISWVLLAIAKKYGLPWPAAILLFEYRMQPWVSLLWAAGAVTVVLYAGRVASRKMWLAGGGAVLLLAIKMLLVDLDTLSLPAKVGVFLVTGLALIGLGRYSPKPPAVKEASATAA